MNETALDDLAMAQRLRLMADKLRAEAVALEAKHRREHRKPKGVINSLREAGLWDRKPRQEKRK